MKNSLSIRTITVRPLSSDQGGGVQYSKIVVIADLSFLARSDRLGVINMEEPAKSRLSPHVHTNIFETTRFMWTEPFKSHPGKRYMKKPFQSEQPNLTMRV